MGEGRYDSYYDYDEVLNFIISYKQEHDGNSPSLREIGTQFGINSTSHIQYILRQLESDGKIEIERGKAKAIRVPGGEWIYHG